MTGRASIIEVRRAVLALGDTNVIVRLAAAIAEVQGLLAVRQGSEWVTLGEEGRTHIHLKIEEESRFLYRAPQEGNAVLDVMGPDGQTVCRVSVRGMNPTRQEQDDARRTALAREWLTHRARCAGF